MKHFETKFASTDFKLNFLNLIKFKIFFLRKIDFLKKLIRNFNLPLNEAGYMYPIMYKSRVMEIIYKYISNDICYKIIF